MPVDPVFEGFELPEVATPTTLAEPDMRRICEALGFDPTNHHNAAKCPYCTPPAKASLEEVKRERDENWARMCDYRDEAARRHAENLTLRAERDAEKADAGKWFNEYMGLSAKTNTVIVAAERRATHAEEKLAKAEALIKRFRQWDHLDGAADGPMWKRDIDEYLGEK